MDDPKLGELRRLVGHHEKLVYEAVKAGLVAELPHESQLYAKAIQEHMHLKHVHNALEFADLREGMPYEITVDGVTVNPMAHVAAHAAVKEQIEQDPSVRAAFEKMIVTGTSPHHAEHVLSAILMEAQWESARAIQDGEDPGKGPRIYNRKLHKLAHDSAFRKKYVRKFSEDHSVFE
jgi:Domain of unknown function (DUF1841)